MNPTLVFGVDVGLTILVSLGLVFYIAKHLRALLIELCGTAQRASFWLAFSNVSLTLVPLIFALDYTPLTESNKALIFELAGQLKYALIGFIATLAVLALILMAFIPREKPSSAVRAAG